jgi:hypothetical protein
MIRGGQRLAMLRFTPLNSFFSGRSTYVLPALVGFRLMLLMIYTLPQQS